MAVLVTQHLYLYMARPLYVFFYINVRIAEGGLRFSLRRQKRRYEPNVVMAYSHAPAAAASSCLNNYRILHLLGYLQRFLFGFDDRFRPWYYRLTGFFRGIFGGHLIAHAPDIVRRRADEGDLARFAYLGEVRVFRQETVAGMYRLDVRYLSGAYYAGDVQLAVCAGGRAYAYRFVGVFYV